jgi:hypothetical protein
LGGKQGGGGRGGDTYRETGGGGECGSSLFNRVILQVSPRGRRGMVGSQAAKMHDTCKFTSRWRPPFTNRSVIHPFSFAAQVKTSRSQENTPESECVYVCEKGGGRLSKNQRVSPETPHPKGEHGLCVCVWGGGGGRYPCSICNAHYPCSIAASSRLVLEEGAQHQTMVRVAGSIESVRICATVCAWHTQLQAPLRLRPGWS